MARLTAKGVERARTGRHGDGQGLYLLVSVTGAKSWLLRVQVHGRRRDIGLGSTAQLSLAEARDKARDLRRVAKAGGDPIAVRDFAKATTPTFEDAAAECHRRGPPSRWRERHAAAFMASLRQHAFPKIGRLHVDSVDENSVIIVLGPLWHDKPAAARKLRQAIRTVLDFAKVSGWRDFGAPTISPRAALGRQPRPSNFASLPYAELPAVVAQLRSRPVSSGRLAVLFAILTGSRSGEVRSARWSDVDLEARLWSRPAAVMKNGEAHTVTLSPTALHLLEQAERFRPLSGDLIFPGQRGGELSDMALLKIVKAEAGQVTLHGMRATFRTWCAEKMPTVPEAVAEAAIAHRVPDAVVRAYQRAHFIELRRQLLDAWAAFIVGESNVVRLVTAS